MSESRPIPQAFIDRLALDRPHDYTELVESLKSKPVTSIRLHPRKRPLIETSGPIPWCKDGYYLDERPRFHLDPFWHAGAYYVQEASSMFLERAFAQMKLKANPVVLDACAAPGGKSSHILSFLNGKGLLCSNEIIPKRNLVLRENLVKWGYPNTVITQNAIHQFHRLGACFDVIVVDAPCSGEGLFRREEAAIRDWSPAHVTSCAQRQHGLLVDTVRLIKPGGYLLYSTCTYSQAENEDQITSLIKNFDLEHVDILHDELPEIERGNDELGYRFYPHKIRGEGFYMALLKKPGILYSDTNEKRKSVAADDMGDLIQLDDQHIVQSIGGNQFIFPLHAMQQQQKFKNTMNVTFSGLFAGTVIHGKFKPVHALALSDFVHPDCPIIDIDLEAAISYLKKEALPLPGDGSTGWHLIRYKGVNLGWAKLLPNRMNNYYPKSWSIRP